MRIQLSVKGRMSWIIVFVTIGIPMLAFFVGNWLKLPDRSQYWQVVATLLAIGMIVTPILFLQSLVRWFRGRSHSKHEQEKAEDRPEKKKFSNKLVLTLGLLVIIWVLTKDSLVE